MRNIRLGAELDNAVPTILKECGEMFREERTED